MLIDLVALFRRQRGSAVFARALGVERQVVLVFPAELAPRLGHGNVAVHGPGNALGQIRGVGGDLMDNHALLHVVAVQEVRQRAATRGLVTEEVIEGLACPVNPNDYVSLHVAPERCIGSPCMNGGFCRDFGSGLNCSCPAAYTGIGCEYEFDACAEGVCQNGATCVDNGPDYQCVCPEGYTGEHCEDNVDDCQPGVCPPAATCIDLTGDFYCR